MKNILIVCADKDLRKDISKKLATITNSIYLDVDDMLQFELLKHQNVALNEAGAVLRTMQQDCINRANEYKNCIITISNDVFVANDNFKLFNASVKIFISLSKAYFVARMQGKDQHRLEQQLTLFNQVNMLVKNNCNYIIDKDARTIDEICQEIVLVIEQKKSH